MRQALAIYRASNEQFTGSADGIKDAFALTKNQIAKKYKDLYAAVAKTFQILDSRKKELEKLNAEEAELIRLRDGALSMVEKTQGKADEARHREAFKRYQKQIAGIEARQAGLVKQIDEVSRNYDTQKNLLVELQSQIDNLGAQEAQAIADFVGNSQMVEIRNMVKGINSEVDMSPIQAVLARNEELSAQAKLGEELDGTDLKSQDAVYRQAGGETSADDVLEKMLKARRASREVDSSSARPVEAERPKIVD